MHLRRVRVSTLIGVLAADAVSLAVTWGWLFAWPAVFELEHATGGLVQPTLAADLVTVAIAGPVLLLGRVSLADVGLSSSGLARGLAVLVVTYVGIQLGLAATALAAGDGVRAGAALRVGPPIVFGGVIAQLIGTAIVEEALYRGLLLRQLALRMRIAPAVVAAAALFALSHVPQRVIIMDLGGLDLAANLIATGLGGVLASYLYLRSGNLWIVVALHALFNDAAPLVASPVPPQWILGVIVLCVIMMIEREHRRRCWLVEHVDHRELGV